MQSDTTKERAVVIIPTYNESENIVRLLKLFTESVFPQITHYEMHAVVVDGNSPDGTGAVVRESALKNPRIHLVMESSKNGIGAAYLQGFDYAEKTLNADVVIEFDADFQHPPEMIAHLLAKIDEGYDYVIGSRRMAGGSEPIGRNIFRRFLTNFGGFLARFILFFPGKNFHLVTDPTTGLKATRVKGVLDKLDLSPAHLYSKKFGYKVQLLSETLDTGARFAEIPLNFQNRAAGISKFESDTTWEILWACVRTRLGK